MIDFLHRFTDHDLLLISTIFIIITVITYVLREFIQPIVKTYKLRHPMSGVFVITSADRYKIPYAIQDENEHLTKELIVPVNSLVYLHMRFKNKLGFTQHHFTFYFDGDRGKNPEIKEWFVPFVKEGEIAQRTLGMFFQGQLRAIRT